MKHVSAERVEVNLKEKFIGNQQDESIDENDIFHPNNREWLQGQLTEADEDIKAGRAVPANKALFDDVIARGKARLKKVAVKI
jgi:hypothetical protein